MTTTELEGMHILVIFGEKMTGGLNALLKTGTIVTKCPYADNYPRVHVVARAFSAMMLRLPTHITRSGARVGCKV